MNPEPLKTLWMLLKAWQSPQMETVPAHTIFRFKDGFFRADGRYGAYVDWPEKYPDWFALVEPETIRFADDIVYKRWVPKVGDEYWAIELYWGNYDGQNILSWVHRVTPHRVGSFNWETANPAFRTREAAEKALKVLMEQPQE